MSAVAGGPPAAAPYPDIIPGIIPFGSICLLSGPPHRGKTALLCTLLARMLNRQSVFGQETHPPNAIAFIVTDHKHQLNQTLWLERAGIADRVTLYSLRNDREFNWKRLRDADQRIGVFRDCLAKVGLPPGGLLIVDPVALFISSRLNDYHSVAIGLGEIDQLLQEYQLTLLGTAHTGKQTDDPKKTYKRPIDRIMGSGAQIGFADTAMALLGPDDIEQDYYELHVSPAMVPEFTAYYRRDHQGLFIPHTRLEDVGLGTDPGDGPNASDSPSDADRATQLLFLIPADGARTQLLLDKAQQALAISRAQFFRELKTLRARGLIRTEADGVIYKRRIS